MAGEEQGGGMFDLVVWLILRAAQPAGSCVAFRCLLVSPIHSTAEVTTTALSEERRSWHRRPRATVVESQRQGVVVVVRPPARSRAYNGGCDGGGSRSVQLV